MTSEPYWDFRWYRGRSAIDEAEFRTEWQSLVDTDARATIFHEPALANVWLESKARAIGAEPTFCLATDRHYRRVLIPFCRLPVSWRNTYQRRLISVGEPHFDYQQPSGSSEDLDWPSFWLALSHELDRGEFCETAMLSRITSQRAPEAAVADGSVTSPYIPLSAHASWDSYLASRPSNHRTDVRRRIRRLSELGRVELKVFNRDELEPAQLELATMRAAYERLWQGTPSEGLFRQPGTFEFYRELIRQLLPTGLLHYSVLSLDGKPVAWHCGFLHRGVLHWYKPTYEPSLKDHSPGKVLLAELAMMGFRDQWREIDFGCGPESYKFLWTDSERQLKQWMWSSKSLRGRVCRSVRTLAKPFRKSGLV